MTSATDNAGSPERLDALDIGLALLAIGAGSMDALGLFALGALPSAMTGNTALLGLALGQGHLDAIASPLAAGVGFVLGAASAAAMLHLGLASQPARRAAGWLLVGEACLLAGFLLIWLSTDRSATPLPLYALVLGAAGMGVQSVAALQVNRPGVITVVITSTLTAIVIALAEAILGSPRRLGVAAKRQILVFFAYGIGAVAVGLLTWQRSDAIPFLPLSAAVVALYLHRRG